MQFYHFAAVCMRLWAIWFVTFYSCKRSLITLPVQFGAIWFVLFTSPFSLHHFGAIWFVPQKTLSWSMSCLSCVAIWCERAMWLHSTSVGMKLIYLVWCIISELKISGVISCNNKSISNSNMNSYAEEYRSREKGKIM